MEKDDLRRIQHELDELRKDVREVRDAYIGAKAAGRLAIGASMAVGGAVATIVGWLLK